jgi:hypothetical protein
MGPLTIQLPEEAYHALDRQAQEAETMLVALLTERIVRAFQPPEEIGQTAVMDKLERYRQILERILNQYAAIPYSLGELTCEAIFDRDRDRYLLATHGRDLGKRVHFAVAHVDIINGKLWIISDNTEDGIATELVVAGVPKEDIVLGFKSEEMRRHGEFAVA